MSDRMGFLGGSDIAALLGISPWTTPYALWEEKVYGTKEESSESRDKVLRRGKRLEPVVMEMLQDEYDLAVTGRNVILHDPEFAFLRAEIDFQYIDDAGTHNGDVKTVHPFAAKDWGEPWSDQVPVYYVAQFQHGMMISGAQQCFVAALIGADDLRPYIVKRDDEIIDMIRKRAVSFWRNNVQQQVAPELQNASDAERVLAKFKGVAVPADDKIRSAIRYLKGIRAAEKRLKLKGAEFEAAIKLTLALNADRYGDEKRCAVVDEAGAPLITWNEQSRAGYTVKPATFRVLRIAGEASR